ncbi:hydroxyacid dehydrogenase [Gudongella sp. DL1XJH-153]|uniref:hydroxyacid dehydrogenase n=1 Tax=Gudongella sp. DL1XJH-153 TaxID=3409804 RepID=UPI003BB5AFAC
MKIFILDPIHSIPLADANQIGEVIKWDDEEIDNISEAEAIIVRTSIIDRERINRMPQLKIIAKHGIGTDNIDLEHAKEKGIIVTNTPTANMESVAELVVALTLASARKIAYSHDLTREGLDKPAPKELTGLELGGKNVGLIGTGRIGQKVGSIFSAGFNMKVYGYDPFLTEEKAKELGIVKVDTVKELLKEADVVSISVPLTKDTTNLISMDELKQMKENAILINTSRGKIVNEADLYIALKEGIIRAAALDVFEIEPPKKDNPLLSLSNFIATPHIGAATEEALIRMGQTAVEEIKLLMNEQTPKFIVNR